MRIFEGFQKGNIEGNFEEWIRKEVETADHEADQIQMMSFVNYFDIGIKIEYLKD